MIDLNDLRRKTDAARAFKVEHGGVTLECRLPTQHEVEVEAARSREHNGAPDAAFLLRLRRALAERSVVGWSGVTLEHLAPGGGPEVAEFSAAAVPYLLDKNHDLTEQLMTRFVEERAARQAKTDAASGN